MKNLKFLVMIISLMMLMTVQMQAQNVGIGDTLFTPDASAILDIKSTTGGLLIPRMTTTQRDAISSPAQSLLIFNTTTTCFETFVNGQWKPLWCDPCSIFNITVSTNLDTICEGDSAILSASSANSYLWSTGDTNNFILVSPSATSIYYVSGTNNGCIDEDSIQIYVNTLPSQPSNINGPTVLCNSYSIISTEEFNSDVLVHGTSAPTTVWFAPSYNTPISYNSINGCPPGSIGYSGSWNNYWGNFVRLPELNCNSLDTISLSFDVSHSYFDTHPNDWCRFYMWADNAYKHNVISVKIDNVDHTYDAGVNGKGFKFSEERSCAHVEVLFDISNIVNKSNILFYIEPSCGYNDSKTFYVWFDNISVSSYTVNNNAVYSVTDEGFIYNWSVPTGWIINSGQNTNVINVTANNNSGFVTVTPYNDCGDGPSSNIYVEICP
ncbi:MAG: hypothetical protein WBI08_08825 [Bacteroidales bacterium]|jgi:hypothetical protein